MQVEMASRNLLVALLERRPRGADDEAIPFTVVADPLAVASLDGRQRSEDSDADTGRGAAAERQRRGACAAATDAVTERHEWQWCHGSDAAHAAGTGETAGNPAVPTQSVSALHSSLTPPFTPLLP